MTANMVWIGSGGREGREAGEQTVESWMGRPLATAGEKHHIIMVEDTGLGDSFT